MTHVPRAPMHPSEVPQQRVYLLKDMPKRPDGFRGSCIYYEGVPQGLTEPDFADHPTLQTNQHRFWGLRPQPPPGEQRSRA